MENLSVGCFYQNYTRGSVIFLSIGRVSFINASLFSDEYCNKASEESLVCTSGTNFSEKYSQKLGKLLQI